MICDRRMLEAINFKTLQKSFRNIAPEDIGYCLQSGEINFQNEQKALKYAKNTILSALEKGHERQVILKDSRILKVMDGNENSVTCQFRDFPPFAGSTQLHGHPGDADGLTLPFSVADSRVFLMLNKLLGYSKSIVYNDLG